MAVTDGDIVKVVQNIAMPNLQFGQNIYYWQLDDPTPDSPSNAQIVSALDTKLFNMYDDLDDQMSNGYQFSDFDVERVVWDGTKWETQENVGGDIITVVGDNALDAVPHGVAAVTTMQTSRPQTRGRKFVPGFTEGNTTHSTWSAGVLNVFTAFLVEWLADMLVVGSAYLVPGVPSQSGPTAGTWYPFISGYISSIAGYQRRRKPGVGV